jgi:hypothetical protein
VSPFRRKRDGKDESSQETVEAPAAPGADEPDPAAWALPADAGAVTTDAGTAATDAAAVEAEEPAAVAAAPEVVAPVDPSPAPETAAAGWTPPPASPESSSSGLDTAAALETFNEVTEQRPELLVAGAFAGAFLFARILKRITDG